MLDDAGARLAASLHSNAIPFPLRAIVWAVEEAQQCSNGLAALQAHGKIPAGSAATCTEAPRQQAVGDLCMLPLLPIDLVHMSLWFVVWHYDAVASLCKACVEAGALVRWHA